MLGTVVYHSARGSVFSSFLPMSVSTGPSQLSTYLADRIRQAFEPGALLPSERALAEQFRCARGTVRAAIAQLAEEGQLESIPRQGHRLRAPAAAEQDAGAAVSSRCWPVVALLTFGRNFQDPNMLDVVAGAITQARAESVHLLTMDIGDERWVETLTTLESLHPGCQVDGYVVTGKPPLPVRQLLEKSVKPCVLLGNFRGEAPLQQGRFLRIGTSTDQSTEDVATHLAELGHRRILAVTGGQGSRILDIFRRVFEEQQVGDWRVDNLPLSLYDPAKDYVAAGLAMGEQVMAHLSDHTAVFVNFGSYGGLDIWKHLQASGRRIPQELSVVIGGGRFDLYVDVYGIATVRRSARLEGEICIQEIVRQIQSGQVAYGSRYLGGEYLPRTTVGPAPDQ